MRNVVAMQALQDRKNGKVTTASLVEDLHRIAIQGEIEDVAIVFSTKGNKIEAWWSTDSLYALGLFQTGIDQVLADMRESD